MRTGLYIHERWTWSARHPVVTLPWKFRLSFGGRHFASRLGDLDANLGWRSWMILKSKRA